MRKPHRERKNLLSLGLLSKWLQKPELGPCGSHVKGRDPTTWSLLCFPFSSSTLAGSWVGSAAAPQLHPSCELLKTPCSFSPLQPQDLISDHRRRAASSICYGPDPASFGGSISPPDLCGPGQQCSGLTFSVRMAPICWGSRKQAGQPGLS